MYQGSAALAAFDGGVLASWYDARSGTAAIYSNVIFPDGGSSSASGSRLVGSNADSPGAACSTTQCLVAWIGIDPGNIDIGATVQGRVRAVRVGFEGQPIDAEPIDLGPASPQYAGARPAVASDGTDFFVMYPSSIAGQLRAQNALVTAAGAVVAGSPPPLSTGEASQWFPSATWTGTAYLAAWTERGSSNVVRAAQFSSAGAIVAGTELVVPVVGGAPWQTATSCRSDSCLIAWGHPPTNTVSGMRLALDGTRLDAQPLSLSTGTTQIPTLTAVPEGDGYLLVHSSPGGITAIHLAASGTVTPVSPPSFADAGIGDPSLAGSGGRILLAVDESSLGSSDVALSWLQPGGAAFGDRAQVIPMLGPSQSVPSVAQVDGGHMLVWQDWRGGGSELRAAFVDPESGLSPPDGTPLPSGLVGTSGIAVHPCGADVLVAWDNALPSERLQLLRLRADGTPIGLPVDVAQHPTSLQSVTIAASDEVCVVAWSQYDNRWDTYAVRFDTDGGRLDPTPLVVANGAGDQYLPSAVWDGTAFLIAYANGPGGAVTSIHARRLNPDGTFAGPAFPLVSTGRSFVRIDCEGNDCLLLWSEAAGAEPTLRVSRIDPATGAATPDGGVVIASIPRTLNANTSELTAGPEGFHVTWIVETDAGTGLRVAKIDPAGPSVLSTFDVPTGAVQVGGPAIAAGRAGETLLAWGGVDPPPHDGTRRVRARLLLDRALGAGCGADSECRSGHCVDGVCCEAACGGGLDSDCQACSGAKGSTAPDGTCGIVSPEIICRPATHACDQAEHCSGSALVCPADTSAEDGTGCPGGTCVAAVCELIDAGVEPGPAPWFENKHLVVGCSCESSRSSTLNLVALLVLGLLIRIRGARSGRNSFF